MRARTSSGSGWTLRKQTNQRRQKSASKPRKVFLEALHVERLEDRLLLTATPTGDDNSWSPLAGAGGVGDGLDPLGSAAQAPTGSSAEAPLSSVPQLHSNSGATAKLFLDFDG